MGAVAGVSHHRQGSPKDRIVQLQDILHLIGLFGESDEWMGGSQTRCFNCVASHKINNATLRPQKKELLGSTRGFVEINSRVEVE